VDLLLANVGEFPRYTLQSYLFDGNWLMGLFLPASEHQCKGTMTNQITLAVFTPTDRLHDSPDLNGTAAARSLTDWSQTALQKRSGEIDEHIITRGLSETE